MMTTRVQSRSTTSITCDEKKIVVPRSVRWRRTLRIARTEIGSMPFNGSSRKSTLGLWMSADASAVDADIHAGLRRTPSITNSTTIGIAAAMADTPRLPAIGS